MEYYLTIKRNHKKWLNVKCIFLSEEKQYVKSTCSFIFVTDSMEKENYRNSKTLVVAKGRRHNKW